MKTQKSKLKTQNQQLGIPVSHRLLRELRQTYLVNVDNDGHLKASITEIMDLWDRVNRELQIVTID